MKHMVIIVLFLSATILNSNAHAQESPHGPIKFDCQTCHAPDTWTMRRNAPFDHTKVGFIS